MKNLKISENKEDLESEEEEEEDAADSRKQYFVAQPGNRTGDFTENNRANIKAAEEFEEEMFFSYCAIASGYDFIDQNLELVVPDSTNPFSQFLDRIRVSKITPGMLIPLLSFDDEPPGYSNLRSQIRAVYASIPDG